MTNLATRSRRWCFTLNNPVRPPTMGARQDDPFRWAVQSRRYLVYQYEEGESGTPHFQGFFVFHQSKSLEYLKLRVHDRAHWEPMRSSIAVNYKYCTKDEGRLDGPWTYGHRPNPGKRNDLVDVCDGIINGDTMKSLALAYPSTYVKYPRGLHLLQTISRPKERGVPSIFVYSGPSGVGKTRLVHEVFPEAYWKPKNKWWDGYDGEDVVVLDEFYSWLSLDLLLRLLDRYPLYCEIKGGTVRMVATVFIFTSNIPVSEWYSQLPMNRKQPLYRRMQEWGQNYEWSERINKFVLQIV